MFQKFIRRNKKDEKVKETVNKIPLILRKQIQKTEERL